MANLIADPAARRDAPQQAAQDARLRHLARRLHELGERPLYEFIREVIAGRDPLERLEVYGRLDPAIVRALDGDRLPELRAVAGRRR